MIRYALIGAGGTGTHLLPALLKYLNTKHGDEHWTLGIIDGDTVEPKNLERQLFQTHNITLNKAIAAATEANDPHIIAIPEYLSAENIARFIRNDAVTIIAVDNYPVRALIETHVRTLRDAIVINLGNEESTGSCQVWIRESGDNITPPMSFLHDEILSEGDDRAAMSCVQVAAIPGGEQLIITNMASAMYGLTALMLYHQNTERTWTEIQFDLIAGKTIPMNQTERRGWREIYA